MSRERPVGVIIKIIAINKEEASGDCYRWSSNECRGSNSREGPVGEFIEAIGLSKE